MDFNISSEKVFALEVETLDSEDCDMTNITMVGNTSPWQQSVHDLRLTTFIESTTATLSLPAQPLPLGPNIVAENFFDIFKIFNNSRQQLTIPFNEPQAIPDDLAREFRAWERLSDDVYLQFERELE